RGRKTGEGLKLARAVLSGTVLLRRAFVKDLADLPGGAARIDASREAVRCGQAGKRCDAVTRLASPPRKPLRTMPAALPGRQGSAPGSVAGRSTAAARRQNCPRPTPFSPGRA